VKIMVALDGSALARAALEPAGELADILGGSLLLTSIVTFPQYAAYADGYTFVDADQTNNVVAETRHELEELAAGLRTETRLVEVAVTYGSPYFGITALARDLGAGLLVMATHGRSGMSRAVLGSVATATIRRTEVPILLVRPVETQQVVEALPAIEAPPVAALVEAEPTIAIALSATELEMLTKVVGERFHNEPVDPRSAEPVRRLLEKLRAARAVPPAQAPASPLAPVGSRR
jgi:nucleotide-binding universal stress UspA family protein